MGGITRPYLLTNSRIAHTRYARGYRGDSGKRTVRQIQYTIAVVRASVSYSDNDRTPISAIGHSNLTP